MWKCIVLLCSIAGVQTREARLVNIAQGPVRGYKSQNDNLYAFYGIPYATAPTGDHKFKAPLPPPQWTEPFEAVNKDIICPQIVLPNMPLEIKLKQQEDCLIANIYVPDTDEKDLPVVIHVHGGAYLLGYGDLMTAKQLVKDKNIIIVNFNYRLGAHGFLCLGTEDVPGNAGMKDQVALFRWVKENIASFGGNPDDVTISGFSAGSSSVDLHLVSPMTKGLFNKVIPESGASLSVFSVQTDPVENAWKYAKMLNYTNENNDIYDLEFFYKSASYETLNSINLLNEPDSTFYFVPCVEREQGEERFLDDAPLKVLKSGRNHKLPMLFGFAEMEGLFRVPLFETWFNKMNENFADFLPGDLQFSNSEEKEEVAQRIKEFYFGKKPVGKETIFRYIDYFTDVLFAYGTLKSVQLQVESGNNGIYLYEYSFVDDNVPLVPYTVVRGADHCAQSMAIGDGIFPNAPADTTDFKSMKKTMRELWFNFIKTGKPVPEGSDLLMWPPTHANGGPHMSLDKTMKLRGPLIQQRILFWDAIYEKHYKMPIAPPHPTARTKTDL
ncbi:unnamed protein product [Parnassius apollo]|uniref:Carboxylic ester hydrolase n=1 Tax=Parnassius apollo TaxID=110799 RepID=A0A8S3WJI9_PARAO|nr:unnamed protein product [Parnassius apollo]